MKFLELLKHIGAGGNVLLTIWPWLFNFITWFKLYFLILTFLPGYTNSEVPCAEITQGAEPSHRALGKIFKFQGKFEIQQLLDTMKTTSLGQRSLRQMDYIPFDNVSLQSEALAAATDEKLVLCKKSRCHRKGGWQCSVDSGVWHACAVPNRNIQPNSKHD